MSAGAHMLAHELELMGQVAAAALNAQYPGIQIQFPSGPGIYWSVMIPHGAGAATGSGLTLSDAIATATR